MGKRILHACKDVPFWGGASTVQYQLFERMRGDGLEVSYVNVLAASEVAFLRRQFGEDYGNPHRLADVHTCILDEPLGNAYAPLAALVEELSPDLLVARGFIAALLLRLAAPRLPLIFLTAGTRAVQQLIENGVVHDFIGFQRGVARGVPYRMPRNSQERQAVEGADLVIAHSPLVRFAFEHLMPVQRGRIYANDVWVADMVYREADEFAPLRRPFDQRDIDVLFVANSWNRSIKNYALVRQIGSDLDGARLHVVGEVERQCPAVRHHGILTRRRDLYELLGRTKTLVCPSLLDAAPAVLFEASAMGCNVVASPNCGNWRLCNERLLASGGTRRELVASIERSLLGPFPDNRTQFLGGYEDLLDTLSVF